MVNRKGSISNFPTFLSQVLVTMTYRREIANLPIPSNEQVEWFTKHLLSIHSWYKHLSVKSGNQFVIFMEPDLDRTYTTNHVIYPWNINSKEQYLKAYSHLRYMWLDNNVWNQDGGNIRTDIPNDLIKRWSVTLFPYCHEEFEEAISLLRITLNSGKSESIPNYTKLVELEKKIDFREKYWSNQLTDREHEVLISIDDDAKDSELEKLSTTTKKYIELERDTWPILTELRNFEKEKVDKIIQTVLDDVRTLKQNGY